MAVLPSTRKKARHLLVQALYQWQISDENINEIETQFFADSNMKKVDVDFFRELLHGIPAAVDTLDAAYQPYLDRNQDGLDPVSKALLRMGAYELLHRIDVPYKVAINEAVNLAKTFGPTDSYKYINGVLDKVAMDSRQVEIAAGRR
ncbi:MAG: transcription antitermination factor NusB [Porticoccaceae bacterium]